MNVRNIGIFAHVDAGKTTLSERLLQHCGSIKTFGSVDSGTAHTDRSDIERRRGISVYSTCVPIEWKGCRINLIDTPGHTDFIAEIERSMWALDCAVLLVSAVEGVQPQTEVLYNALKNKPLIIFANKTDRVNADLTNVKESIKENLTDNIVDISDDVSMLEFIAERDEEILDMYLSGKSVQHKVLYDKIKELTAKREAIPFLSGSALKDINIENLLDSITELLPTAVSDTENKPAGIIFHTETDKSLGRAAYIRMFSGSLKNRQQIGEKKITQIRDISLTGKSADKGELSAGEIGIVYGLGDVKAGDAVGDGELPEEIAAGRLKKPLLLVKVEAKDAEKHEELRKALTELSIEDPLLGVEEYQRQLHIKIMGAVQLEIIADTLRTRFDLDVEFGQPNVIYRETIRHAAQGFYAYTMPKPCWAVLDMYIEPLPRGSGVKFQSTVPVREISPRYQHQVEQAIENATNQGMLGWKVDDILITLVGGSEHKFHTHPLDFVVATPIAAMMGLANAGQVLLEPVLDVRLSVPEDCSQRVMGEIIAMRGMVTDSVLKKGMIQLECELPVATSIDFPKSLASMTGGRGTMSAKLKGYQEAPDDVMVTCPRRGVDPLDTAKYILAARNALEGGIFDY